MFKLPPLKVILGRCAGIKYGAVIEGATPHLVRTKKLNSILNNMYNTMGNYCHNEKTISEEVYSTIGNLTKSCRKNPLPEYKNTFIFDAFHGQAQVYDKATNDNVLYIYEKLEHPLKQFIKFSHN